MDPVARGGGVVWRTTGSGVEVVLVHHRETGWWSLPKGKQEPHERLLDCARREVLEETGVTCPAGEVVATVASRDRMGRPAIVQYWSMPVDDPDVSPRPAPAVEIDEARWWRLDEALDRAAGPGDSVVLGAFAHRVSLAPPPSVSGLIVVVDGASRDAAALVRTVRSHRIGAIVSDREDAGVASVAATLGTSLAVGRPTWGKASDDWRGLVERCGRRRTLVVGSTVLEGLVSLAATDGLPAAALAATSTRGPRSGVVGAVGAAPPTSPGPWAFVTEHGTGRITAVVVLSPDGSGIAAGPERGNDRNVPQDREGR